MTNHLSLKMLEKDSCLSLLLMSFWQCFVSVLSSALKLADASASRHISASCELIPFRLAWHCLMLVTDRTLPPIFTWMESC